jgi:hypothetical protein
VATGDDSPVITGQQEQRASNEEVARIEEPMGEKQHEAQRSMVCWSSEVKSQRREASDGKHDAEQAQRAPGAITKHVCVGWRVVIMACRGR